jgi:hypothetical protein
MLAWVIGVGRNPGYIASVGDAVKPFPVFGAEAGFGRESAFPVLILLG